MKHVKGVKRLGSRYGLGVKKKLGKVEALKKSTKECPYCNYPALERLAAGIWYCKKCKKKFTGKAYTVSKQVQKVEEDGKV